MLEDPKYSAIVGSEDLSEDKVLKCVSALTHR